MTGQRGRVIGLDLSLTSTGVAAAGWTELIRPGGGLAGCSRLRAIKAAVWEYAAAADLIVVEGPSYGSRGRGQHERAGLWWLIVEQVDRAGIAWAQVPPKVRARYATGTGNADKDRVLLAAAKRFGWFDGGNDEADALWLAAMGHDHLGRPLIDLPGAHRRALTSVTWPELPPVVVH